MKYSKIRKELGVNVVKGESEELAILTHHMQSGNDNAVNAFAEDTIISFFTAWLLIARY